MSTATQPQKPQLLRLTRVHPVSSARHVFSVIAWGLFLLIASGLAFDYLVAKTETVFQQIALAADHSFWLLFFFLGARAFTSLLSR